MIEKKQGAAAAAPAPEANIYEKLVWFAGKIPAMDRLGQNPHFKSQYITFDEIMKQLRPIALECGLFISHSVENEVLENGLTKVSVTPMVYDTKGEYFKGGTMCSVIPNQVQQIGSVTTYLKRYSISAMLGIAADVDDDGEANRQEFESKTYTRQAIEKHKPEPPAPKKEKGPFVAPNLALEEKKAKLKQQINDMVKVLKPVKEDGIALFKTACGGKQKNLEQFNEIELVTLRDLLKARLNNLKGMLKEEPAAEPKSEIDPPVPFAED